MLKELIFSSQDDLQDQRLKEMPDEISEISLVVPFISGVSKHCPPGRNSICSFLTCLTPGRSFWTLRLLSAFPSVLPLPSSAKPQVDIKPLITTLQAQLQAIIYRWAEVGLICQVSPVLSPGPALGSYNTNNHNNCT